MYINVSNDIGNLNDAPDSSLIFGTSKYPIISFIASLKSTTIADRILENPQIKEFKFSSCNTDIARGVADFLMGKDLQINLKNAGPLYDVALEMGIIDLIENIQIIIEANKKIKKVLACLVKDSKKNKVLNFAAHYFAVLTFYDEFLDVPSDTLESIFNRDVLGITSDKALLMWLIKYKEKQTDNTQAEKVESFFKFINVNSLNTTDKLEFWKKHKDIVSKLRTESVNLTTRMFIDSTNTEGFKSILTQIINTPV